PRPGASRGWLSLRELYGRNGPLAFVSCDGNPKAVELIEPNFFHCPGFAIGQYDAFADKLGLRLLELGKDFQCVSLCARHRGRNLKPRWSYINASCALRLRTLSSSSRNNFLP